MRVTHSGRQGVDILFFVDYMDKDDQLIGSNFVRPAWHGVPAPVPSAPSRWRENVDAAKEFIAEHLSWPLYVLYVLMDWAVGSPEQAVAELHEAGTTASCERIARVHPDRVVKCSLDGVAAECGIHRGQALSLRVTLSPGVLPEPSVRLRKDGDAK